MLNKEPVGSLLDKEPIGRLVHKKFETAYKLTCQVIDKDTSITKLKKKYLKQTAKRLCKIEIEAEVNRRIDLKGMIQADIESRALNKQPIGICRCDSNNTYCFCVDPFNKYIRI